MPGGNGTGPMGTGPMTGRGMGYCAGYSRPGFVNPGFGRGTGWGRGRGRGFGMGWRNRWADPFYSAPVYPAQPYMQPATAQNEADALKDQANILVKHSKVLINVLVNLEKGTIDLKWSCT